MQVLLQIIAGPATGRRFRLRQGQAATVGRTEWSDFSIPDDSAMADVHFQLHCDAYRCTLRRVDAARETQRNGEPVEQSAVRNGDNISAGASTFLVTLEGAPEFDPRGDNFGSDDAEDARPKAADVAAGVEFSDPAQALLTDGIKAEDFLDALIADERLDDAVRLLAAWLPPPQSVAWGCACLKQFGEGQLSARQKTSVEAAEKWAAEPTEEHRRAAQQAAENLQSRTPAGWIALAAFWSGGSIGSPDAPEIPATPGMSARAVGLVVTTVATWGGSKISAPDALRSFIEQGRQRLPEAK